MELWAEIEAAPGYWVSTDGRVVGVRGQVLKPCPHRQGYHTVALPVRLGGKQRHVLIHRLVLGVFAGDAPEGRYQGSHHNGIKTDNRFANLRWDTPKGNAADKHRHGTARAHNSGKTHCKHGHEFTPENTFHRRDGGRSCRACRREWGTKQRRAAGALPLVRLTPEERRARQQVYERNWRTKNWDRLLGKARSEEGRAKEHARYLRRKAKRSQR